jgi:CubicO group peptidase (beta-lactamase class C family)
MLKKSGLFVLLIGFMVSSAGLGSGFGRKSIPAPSPERFAKVRAMILETLENSGVPSISIAAAENGKIVWEESFGYADKEKKIKATPNSLYALASISKAFTGTALMVLADRKLLDLDKPVNDYLGEAKLTAHVGSADQATLRRMLCLEAGMPMHWNIFHATERAHPPSQDESIRRYGIIVNEPGREYVYSNFAYGVLDRVISHVSGKRYAEFMKDEVFKPPNS